MHAARLRAEATHLGDLSIQSATSSLRIRQPASRTAGFGPCLARSGLERSADSVALVRLGRPALLASVLLAGLPRRGADDLDMLWPLWATEAVFRAEAFLTLLAWAGRSRRRPLRVGRKLDLDLARSLGAQYQAIQVAPARAPLPCSPILRDMTAALVSLFGEVVGRPVLQTDIARLVLPGFQRRALVLAATTLVFDALLHDAKSPTAEGFGLALAVGGRRARLSLVVGDRSWQAGPAWIAAGAMADLLEGELMEIGVGQVEIAFPIPAQAGQ